jgi:hypothetical protein
MTAATVLIPTHAHAAALRHAVAGVQQQNLQDFELFIVGDGVTEATRAVAAELSAADSRIRFFDFPKGPRKGEIHRHRALQEARGRFAAYLGDDDFWMPNHLDVLDALLTEADFGHTMQVSLDAEDQIVVMPAELQDPQFRARMLTELFNRFDFTFAGHTMAAYRRLPFGWRTTPPDFPWTDLYMWRQFLAQPWCRARSAMIPTGINTWTHLRPGLTDQERGDHLASWRARLESPAFRESLWREIAQRFAGDSVRFEFEMVRRGTELAGSRAAYGALEVEYAKAQAELARLHAALGQSLVDCDKAQTGVKNLENQRSALVASLTATRNSTSWRVTAPLRALRRVLARLGGR